VRDRNKDELIEDATEAGVPDAADLTKAEIRERLEAKAPAELGPVIPEGVEPPEVEGGGRPTVGVQPLTDDDIPDAGR
jgi:hypothetical protein